MDPYTSTQPQQVPKDDTPDPWRHRGQKMKCHSCMWWAPNNADRPADRVLGRCRRHAPVMSGYPVVFDTDWCGDHKLDENRY